MPSDRITWLLRAEGLAVGVLALVYYTQLGPSWLLFAVLILVPDLSMLAYLAGARAGAIGYNLVHTYAVVLPALTLALLIGDTIAIAVCVIWTCHVGFDRALGYGLKLPTGFKDTHLGRLR